MTEDRLPDPTPLAAWIESHRDQLRPPVGNVELWRDRTVLGDFIVMVVGGPNHRKDFHVDPGEELFHQIEGTMELIVIEAGKRRVIPIGPGELFRLPAGVPHSPQRPAESVGLVVERVRRPGEIDALQWYCEQCDAQVHEARFELTDIGRQIREAIESLAADENARTCRQCSAVLSLP